MSSLFNQASLVVEPAVYETSKVYATKPFDGSGDLTFTRSNDTATRVGTDGLIEKVRTNLVTYSEEFNLWTASDTTTTANAAANPLDGATTADKVIASATTAEHNIYFSRVSVIAEVTTSIYAKADGYNFLYLRNTSASGGGVWFNLSTGEVATQQSGRVGTITSVGNGWYRCSVTWNQPTAGTNQYIIVGPAPADNTATYLGDGTSGVLLFGAQMEFGVMTDYIATTSAAVSVGPVANVPRLDYLNSSCPRLLLEPQRTNKITYSENQGPTGTNWYPSTTWTVTNNTVTSPSGYQDADTLTETTSNGFHSGYFNAAIDNAYTGTYTISAFAKYNGRLFVLSPKGATERTFFNLQNGTVALLGGGGVTAKIEDYGNGWYRCSVTCSFSNENVNFEHLLALSTSALVYTGDGTSGVHIWGCQAEAGAYATSYIPTLGAAVTRGADVTYKTGIGSLFGANAGTIYFETTYYPETNTGGGERFVYAQGNTSSDYVRLWQDVVGGSKRIRALVGAGGVQVANLSVAATSVGLSDTASGTIKFAFAYENDRFQMYVNGINAGVDTSGTAPTLTEINFNNTFLTLMPLAQALVFPTALSNAQLAELTA